MDAAITSADAHVVQATITSWAAYKAGIALSLFGQSAPVCLGIQYFKDEIT